MSIKLKALLHIFSMLAIGAICGGIVTLLLAYFPSDIILGGLGLVFIVYLISLMYQITVSRLEYEEKLKEISKG